MIGTLATRFVPGDYFLGRMSFWKGRIGTLLPSGVDPKEGIGVTIGRPGSRKSTAAAMTGLLLHDGPTFTYCVKGEITKACAAARGAGGEFAERGRGDTVFVVDPANLSGKRKSRYNPIQEIREETNVDDAIRLMFKLAEGLVKNPCPGSENSWVYDGARDLAYGLIAHLVANYPPQLSTLVMLRQLLQLGDVERFAEARAAKEPGIATAFDALLLRMTEESGGPFGHIIAGQAADVQSMSDRQRGPILKALREATVWLDLPSFQDAVSGCDFRMRDFRTEQISLFVCVPLNELTGIACGFARLFLTMFMQSLYRAPQPPKKPILCLVDEWVQLGKINDFSKIGPTMRSYGVKLWVLIQDLDMAILTYGREEINTLLGCAAFCQILAMTNTTTIEWLVRSLGEHLIRERQPDGRIVKRPYPVLDREQAQRFLAARTGNQIVLRFQERPLMLKVAPYHWFLPFWMYTPDPAYPEPRLRAWMRRRAIRKAAAPPKRRLRHA